MRLKRKIMKLKYLMALLVFGMLFVGCEDDIIEDNQSEIIYQPPKVTVAAGVSGIVTDRQGNALSEVRIQYENQQYTTDENGYFIINDESAREDGALLKFTESGYFENFKFYMPEPGKLSFLRVQMVERNLVGNIDGTIGGSITLNEGAKIQFPANAFKDVSGNDYNGQVNVYAHWYDPAGQDLNAEMPGDLRATNEIGEAIQLATYGMMAVELTSNTGAELNLRDGIKASLEFPLPAALADNAPDEIQTWSFNETSGYWVEESTAVKDNDIYVAEVSHFSFWNCDAPFPVVEIYGKLVDEDGNPLPYYSICIQAFNNTRTGYGWSGIDGSFRGKVPKGELLTFQVKDDCGNIIFEQQIGPFETEVSLGEIVISSPDMITISGKLVDCDGNPVSNGYAKITLEDVSNYYIAPTDEDGNFELQIIRCQPLGNFTVQGWNLDDYSYSEIIEITNSERDVKIGEVILCEELEEYIDVKLPNGDLIVNPIVDAEILDGILIITTGNDSLGDPFGLTVHIDNAMVGSNTDINYFSFVMENANNYYWYRCGQNLGGAIWNDCEDINFEITSLGVVGDYIEGEYMGEFNSTNQNIPDVLMGSFRVLLDRDVDLGTISGKAWNDVDGDGIFGANDFATEIRSISLLDGDQNVLETQYNVSSYQFYALEQGDYYLSVVPYSGSAFTLKDQGPDEDLDSDFDQNGLTDLISLGDNEDLTNVDAGLGYQGFVECWAQSVQPASCGNASGAVELFVDGTGGLWTVEVIYDGVVLTVVTIQGNSYFLDGLTPGSYLFLVTDENGNVCETEAFVEEVILESVIEGSRPLCDQNDGYVYAITNGGFPNNFYSYQWSNGATTSWLQDVGAGTYSVTVSDNFGCESVSTYELESLGGPEMIVGKVFADSLGLNSNVYGDGDYRVRNFLVLLYEASDLNNIIAETTTDNNGVYVFENLAPNDYVVEFVPSNQGQEFVEKDFGTDDTIDSDVDPDTGRSDVVTTGIDCIAIDAGIK